MSGTLPLLPPYAFMQMAGKNVPLPLSYFFKFALLNDLRVFDNFQYTLSELLHKSL
jgi:hypothetical protein